MESTQALNWAFSIIDPNQTDYWKYFRVDFLVFNNPYSELRYVNYGFLNIRVYKKKDTIIVKYAYGDSITVTHFALFYINLLTEDGYNPIIIINGEIIKDLNDLPFYEKTLKTNEITIKIKANLREIISDIPYIELNEVNTLKEIK